MTYFTNGCEKEDEKKEEKKDNIAMKQEEFFHDNRTLFLWGGVDDDSASKLIKAMLYLDSVSQDDITLLINSPGGVISSGLAIYDCMHSIKSDVRTVVCGQAASMGAVLLCAGAPGKRFAWNHARVMIHQPLIQGHMQGPASDIEIQADEMLRIRETLNGILAKHSGQDVETIEKDTDRDNFMDPQQAIDYGLVDAIES
ncbi:MAG: ATP-dependent Clp protease proteolytic subunit [Fibrobacterales bacterium]